MIYYDIELFDNKHNRRTFFTADCFSVSHDRVLHVFSSRFGSCVVQIDPDEELSVKQLIGDDFDE